MKNIKKQLLSGMMASVMVLSLITVYTGDVTAADAADTREMSADTREDTTETAAALQEADSESTETERNAVSEDSIDAQPDQTEVSQDSTADIPEEESRDPTTGDSVQELPFTDVTESDWFYIYVKSVYEKRYMTGLDETTFGPGGQLSRGQFATILYRIENSPEVSYSDIFGDVPDGQFYSEPVIWASEQGIVTGYENGNFGPADRITREQMAVMMYRYGTSKGYDTASVTNDLGTFPDKAAVSLFASEQMQWAVAFGLISGSGGQLVPQGSASRAECATIITRFMDQFQPDHTHNYSLVETTPATNVSAAVERYTCDGCGCTYAKSTGSASKAEMEVENVKQNQGTFRIKISGVSAPYDFDGVQLPTWCSSDQSDIVWYNAKNQGNGIYTVDVDIANHKYHYGIYKADAYLVLNQNNKVSVGRITTEFTPVDYVYSTEVSSTQRNVTVINPTVNGKAAEQVQFPTWSEEGGQDDLVWYEGSNLGDGGWSALVDGENHAHSGTFETDVYGTADGNQVFVGRTFYSMEAGNPYERQANAYAQEVIDSVCNDSMDSWDKLYACYQWSVDLVYAVIDDNVPADYTHCQYFSIHGFENGSGDCYVFAATFCQMAKVLGYDAYLVEGYVPQASGGMVDHGWVEIDMDGTTYVFDPDFETDSGRNGFQITYGASGTWVYTNYQRVD